MRTAASFGLLALAAASSVVARAELPIQDVAARRSTDGTEIVAIAVAEPDTRFPTVEARCLSSRSLATRRARESLHGYVDRASGSELSAATLVRVHAAVESHAVVAEVRSLVDGGSVVRMTVPVRELDRAVGSEVRWP